MVRNDYPLAAGVTTTDAEVRGRRDGKDAAGGGSTDWRDDAIERAASVEPRHELWIRRFRWLFDSGCVAALNDDSRRAAALSSRGLCRQFALRLGEAEEKTGPRGLPQLVDRITALAAAGGEVCLDLSPAKTEQFNAVVGVLGRSIADARAAGRIGPRALSLSLQEQHPALGPFLRLAENPAFRRMRLILRLSCTDAGNEALDAGDGARRWLMLSRLSHERPDIELVPSASVYPLSELHSAENCDAVLPHGLFSAPATSAWLALQVRLDRISDFRHLRPLIRYSLRFADNLIDLLDWPSSNLHLDAMLNRRVAISLTGIGDFVDRAGLDPAGLGTLRRLSRALALIRRMLVRESAQLAARRGAFPGLGVRDLVTSLAPRYGRQDAERMIRQRSLRHRHLLTLSPYALLPGPAAKHELAAYLNLLPAITCADVIGVLGSPARERLALAEFRHLLRMTQALASNRAR